MFEKLIGFSVRFKGLIFALTLALLLLGIYAARHIQMDALPDITDNQIQVITSSPDLDAQDMERLVSAPLEQEFLTLPRVEQVRSLSRPGLSIITLVFEEKADLYWIRQVLSERLLGVGELLPDGLRPTLSPPTTGLGEIFQYTLVQDSSAPKLNLMELRDLQDRVIRKSLLGIEGIAEINSFGGLLRQYEISLKPEMIRKHGIAIEQIRTALANNHLSMGAGLTELNGQAWNLRVLGKMTQLEDLGQIPIYLGENKPSFLLSELAEIRYGSAPRFGALTENGAESVGGIVMAQKGANPQEIINSVRDRIAQIQKNLPKGVRIESFLDRQHLIDRTMDTVKTNLIEASIIVFVVLFAFLGHWRASLIVVSVIPLALCFALLGMYLMGQSVNLISLGAVDFGLIVDGAVILVEAMLSLMILQKIKKMDRNTAERLAIHSSKSMLRSALFGQCMILAVYVPLLALQGIEGRMFKPMAWMVGLAMLGSMILCLTWVPAIMSVMMRGEYKPAHWHERILNGIGDSYAQSLKWFLRLRAMVLLGVLVLLATGLWAFQRLGGEFLPILDEGDFALEMRVLPGSSLSHVVQSTGRVEQALRAEFPEVIKVVSKIGSSEIPTDPMPTEAADVNVILRPKSEWQSAKSREELADKMADFLKQRFPEIATGVEQPVQMRFNELLSGSKQQVSISILGSDLDTLQMLLDQLQSKISGQPGVKDLVAQGVDWVEAWEYAPRPNALAQWNFDRVDLARGLRLVAAGEKLGEIQQGNLLRDIVLRLDMDPQKSNLENLPLVNAHGDVVDLGQLADQQMNLRPSSVQRLLGERKVSLGFNVRGADVMSTVGALQDQLQDWKLPLGYRLEYGGSYRNLISARERLTLIVPVVLALILLCLFAAFRQVKMIFALLAGLPLALVGGVVLLALRNLDLSVPALIGMIALVGIAILNGIVLLVECQKSLLHGAQTEALIQAARSRLRPVLLTASLAALGFFPMAFSDGAGAEIQRPLATVVIGGLCTATLVTLYFLPWMTMILSNKTWSAKLNTSVLVGLGLLVLPSQIKAQEQELQNLPEIKSAQRLGQPLAGPELNLGQLEWSQDWDTHSNFELRHQLSLGNFGEGALRKAMRQEAQTDLEWNLQKARIRAAEYWSESIEIMAKSKIYQRMDSILGSYEKSLLIRQQLGAVGAVEGILLRAQKQELQRDQMLLQHRLKSQNTSWSKWLSQIDSTARSAEHWWKWIGQWTPTDSILNLRKKASGARIDAQIKSLQNTNWPTPFWSIEHKDRQGQLRIGLSYSLDFGLRQRELQSLRAQKEAYLLGLKPSAAIDSSRPFLSSSELLELRVLIAKNLEISPLESFQLWKTWSDMELRLIDQERELRNLQIQKFIPNLEP